MTSEYTMAVYEYLRTLGEPGETVFTDVAKFLQDEFDIPDEKLISTRTKVSHELRDLGLAERPKTRTRYMTILK